MGGRGSGTGQPIQFQCSACRRSRNQRLAGHGRFDRVTLTGKKRHRRRWTGQRVLANGLRVQYLCSDCGHVGWSSHSDLRSLVECDARMKEMTKASIGQEVTGSP